MAAAMSASGNHARRGRRRTSALGFIMPSSAAGLGCAWPPVHMRASRIRSMARLRSRWSAALRLSTLSRQPMTRAEQCVLGGCHPGQRTMCKYKCWWWRITWRWPTGSTRVCATPVSLSMWSTTARRPSRTLRAPATTWSCSTAICQPCTVASAPARSCWDSAGDMAPPSVVTSRFHVDAEQPAGCLAAHPSVTEAPKSPPWATQRV